MLSNFFIFKALIDLYINHDEFGSGNNVLRQRNEVKKEIKSSKNVAEYIIEKQWKRTMSVVRKRL